jgi:hypothetical protein
MGKLVNVVLADGTVSAVSEEDAARLTAGKYAHEQSTEEQTGAARQAVKEREHSGIGSKIRAGVEGLADTATLGAYGKARNYVAGDEVAHDSSADAEVNPGSRFAGEALGLVAPTGLLGDAAKVGSEFTGLGLASEAGEGAAGAVLSKFSNGVATKGVERVAGATGRAVEGAIFGAGAHVAETNVTGDPLTIEGLVEGAGIGSILNVGGGYFADKLMGLGSKAADAAAGAKEIGADYELLSKGQELWRKPPESWESFSEAVQAKQATNQELFNAADKADKAYQGFVKTGLDGQITKAENAINSISRRWNEDIVIPKAADTADASGLGFDVSDNAAKPGMRAGDASGLGFDTSDVNVKAPSTPVEPQRVTKQVLDQETGKYRTWTKAQEPPAPVTVDPRPPITEETATRLKDFRDRLRRIDQLRAGGWDLDAKVQNKFGVSEWSKNPEIAADPKRAVEELRSLQNDLRGQFPKATRKVAFKEIPEAPPAIPPEPDKLRLPKNLKELSLQRPETVAKIHNVVASDPASTAAYERLAKEVGVRPEDGITGLHAELGKYISAQDRLVATARAQAAKEAGDGFIPFLRRGLKKFTVYGVSRAADTALSGGLAGAAGRVFAGEAARVGMDKFEESALGGMLMKARLGTTQRLGELVGKAATATAKGIDKMAPITSFLSQSFPHGESDKERDMRKLAMKRAREVSAAALTAPNHVYAAIQPLLGHDSDIGYSIHSHVTSAMNYLNQTAPKDPGTVMHMFGSDYQPSHDEAMTFAYRMEAVLSPYKAIQRSFGGDYNPAAAEALWTVWPNLMQRVAEEVTHNAIHLQGMTYEKAEGLSALLRAPLTGLQEQTTTVALQGLYLPQPPSAGGGKSGGGAPGRPPAVQSQVAGSSVSGLIH